MKKNKVYTRYPSITKIVIKNAIEGFKKGRKTGIISESAVKKEFEYWSKFPAWKVIGGLIIYNNKNYSSQGKFEKYARGIIRNITEEQARQLHLFTAQNLIEALKNIKTNTIDKCDKCQGGHIIEVGDRGITVYRCDCIKEYEKKRALIFKFNDRWFEEMVK